MRQSLMLAAVCATALSGAAGQTQAATPAYALTKSVPLGAPDRWDYVVFDQPSGRVYVAHGDRLSVVDGAAGRVVGEVAGIPGGTHGTGISAVTGQGFTDDGEAGQVVAFDLKTLKVTHRIAADPDADGIVVDAMTGHVFVVEGDSQKLKVIDPKTDAVAATIAAGEKLEAAVADGAGVVYVAGEEKRDLLKVDARTNAIVARWPTPDCEKPHGVAFDAVGHRVFMGCVNSLMMVVDADSGRVVAKLPIGLGSDAVGFDPRSKRAFSSNGRDGTLSVFQQTTPDQYQALAPIQTAVSGRTMAVDPVSGRLFVVAADTDPSPTPGGRPKPRPGSLRLMLFDPAG